MTPAHQAGDQVAALTLKPVKLARTAGGLYMAVVVLSIFALGATGGVLEPGDPLATAGNLA